MSEPARSNVRILLPEQTRELVDLHVNAPSSITDAPQRVAQAITSEDRRDEDSAGWPGGRDVDAAGGVGSR